VDWNSFEHYDYITRTCLGETTRGNLMKEALALVNEAGHPTKQSASLD
jgi:hypothetical protein